jgi:hypothetical protein
MVYNLPANGELVARNGLGRSVERDPRPSQPVVGGGLRRRVQGGHASPWDRRPSYRLSAQNRGPGMGPGPLGSWQSAPSEHVRSHARTFTVVLKPMRAQISGRTPASAFGTSRFSRITATSHPCRKPFNLIVEPRRSRGQAITAARQPTKPLRGKRPGRKEPKTVKEPPG